MVLPLRARRVLRSVRQAIPAGVLLGRVSAGNGPAEFIPITEATNALLDDITDVHGSVLYRGTAVWEALAPGTSGQFFKTLGAAADPAWDDVTLATPNAFFESIVFQSNFEGADLQTTFVGMDDSLYNHEIVVENGAPALTTTNVKFGTTALNYDLTDAAIRVKACGTEFQIANSAFFIEFFISMDSQANVPHMGIGIPSNSDAMFKIETNGTGSSLEFLISTDGTTYSEPLGDISGGLTPLTHILIVSDGATLSSYVNGTRDDTVAFSSTLFASNADLIIGGIEGTYTGQAELDGVRFGVGTTGGYDPDDASITVPTVYYETTDNTTDLIRTGLVNKYYCKNDMLEDFAGCVATASNVTVTFSSITKEITLTAADQLEALSSTQGAIAYRGASAWEALAPGTDLQLLTSKGAAANPIWTTVATPHLVFIDPLTIYDIRVTVGSNPRTAIISSIASDVITLTTATSGSFFRSNMEGNTYIRIWNTTKTPDESAWVEAAPLTTTLRVQDAADITGWVATDVIQLGDPIAEQPGIVMALDISQALPTVQQNDGFLLVGGIGGASVGTDAIFVTGSGLPGSLIGTASNAAGGAGTTTVKAGPVSPISDSNLVLIREVITTTATIRSVALHGVYVPT